MALLAAALSQLQDGASPIPTVVPAGGPHAIGQYAAGRRHDGRARELHRCHLCGRHLRRYERRWLVEGFFAWLQWKRRLLIRWEYYATNFLGFVQLACITMLLKQF